MPKLKKRTHRKGYRGGISRIARKNNSYEKNTVKSANHNVADFPFSSQDYKLDNPLNLKYDNKLNEIPETLRVGNIDTGMSISSTYTKFTKDIKLESGVNIIFDGSGGTIENALLNRPRIDGYIKGDFSEIDVTGDLSIIARGGDITFASNTIEGYQGGLFLNISSSTFQIKRNIDIGNSYIEMNIGETEQKISTTDKMTFTSPEAITFESTSNNNLIGFKRDWDTSSEYLETANEWSSMVRAEDYINTTNSADGNHVYGLYRGELWGQTESGFDKIFLMRLRYNKVSTSCAFTNNGGGEVKGTVAAHGFVTGDTVTISGTTDYNGSFVVTAITEDRFLFTDTYTSDQSGTVKRAINNTSANDLYGDFSINKDGSIISKGSTNMYENSDHPMTPEAGIGQLWVKTATPNQLYFTTDAGDDIQLTSGTCIAGGGGASALNDLSDVSYSSGDLTITSLDKIAVSGALELETNDGQPAAFSIKGNGNAESAFMFGLEDGSYTSLVMNEQGGSSDADHFTINVGEHGATSLTVIDSAASNGHLQLQSDGELKFRSLSAGTGIGFLSNTVTGATPSTPSSGWGRFWIADTNKTPYFTDSDGVTSSLKGKGFLSWYYYSANLGSTSAFYAERWNDDYGIASSVNSQISNESDTSSSHWQIVRASRIVPYDSTLTKFMVNIEWSGSNGDLSVCLWKGTPPNSSIQSSTVTTTIDMLGSIAFTYSGPGSRTQSKSITSFNATALSQEDYLFITLERQSGTDGSSYHVHSTATFDY